MGILKSFDKHRLRPFRKLAARLTEPLNEEEEKEINNVDPDLKPDEARYVRHFLGFADIFLNRKRQPENVVEMPKPGDKAA